MARVERRGWRGWSGGEGAGGRVKRAVCGEGMARVGGVLSCGAAYDLASWLDRTS
jgi:hypothetical protein